MGGRRGGRRGSLDEVCTLTGQGRVSHPFICIYDMHPAHSSLARSLPAKILSCNNSLLFFLFFKNHLPD